MYVGHAHKQLARSGFINSVATNVPSRPLNEESADVRAVLCLGPISSFHLKWRENPKLKPGLVNRYLSEPQDVR